MLKRTFILLFVALIALSNTNFAARGHQLDTPIYKDASRPLADRVEDLLARMTVEEKIGQMTLVEKNSIKQEDIAQLGIGALLSGGGGYPKSGNTAEEWAKMVDGYQQEALKSRLGIPLLYGVDAVHGHNNLYGTVIFPQQIGLGAANDPELVTRIGQATAQAMLATGIYWDYAPVVAVPQDIRWGRTYESYGENPELVSKMAVALIEGLQGKNLSDPESVLATPKHFVGDGGTKWGSSTTDTYKLDQGVTDVDEATLRAIHLPPYEAAVKSGAMSIMVSFSSWGGMKMSAQKYLMTDVLKGELGFKGFLVSDWQAIDQIPGVYAEQVKISFNAGMDMNMVPYDYHKFIDTMKQLIDSGDIPMTRVDDAVRRILTVKFALGLFERNMSNPKLLSVVGSDEQRALAREAVTKSLVLLQNNDNTLPLSKDVSTVYVAGSGADDIGMQSGGWTIEWQGKTGNITPGTTVLKAVKDAVSSNTTVTYNVSGTFDGVADVGIVVVGERPYAEGKGDKESLTISSLDSNVINRMRQHSKKLVVVLLSGRPMIIGPQLNVSDAFVAAWLPGTEGAGITDALFGDKPFTGKLSFTWPRSNDQLPFDFKNLATSGCESPLFTFGYGLDASSKTTVKDECAPTPDTSSGTTASNAGTTELPKPAAELAAPPEIEGKVVYIPFPAKITVDGKLDEWANIPMSTVARGVSTSNDPEEDGSVTFGVAADDTNLYIAMVVPDKNIITGQHGEDFWNEDSMEFYVNFTGNLAAKQYGDGIFQVNVKPIDIGNKDPNTLKITGINSQGVKVTGYVFKTAKGYGFEVSTPLPQKPEHGKAIGFQVHLNGASEADRNVKLIWSLADKSDQSYQDPSLFGQGIFFQIGSKDIPTAK